jgi:hypothetical protein
MQESLSAFVAHFAAALNTADGPPPSAPGRDASTSRELARIQRIAPST